MRKGFSGKYVLTATTAFVLMFVCGCSALEKPSDITLDELEVKMAQAMDPKGEYRNARAYFQRQNVEEEGFFSKKYQLVEVRFQRPDKFKFSYYEKNKPLAEILSIGGKAWSIDHQRGTVTPITGTELDKFKVMLALSHPDTQYDELFRKVDLFRTRFNDIDCYKLVCYPAMENANAIIVYVNSTTFLPLAMQLKVKTPDGEKKSVSVIEEYQSFNNVKIPALTKVEEDTREYQTRVVGYQLNAVFSEDEFAVPEFNQVLMKIKNDQLFR